MVYKVIIALLLSPAVLSVTVDHLSSKYNQLTASNATANYDLSVDLGMDLSYQQSIKPANYYSEFGDQNLKVVNGQSCKSWRVEEWTTSPKHEESDVHSKFVLGIGPPKTATSYIFSSMASNPNVCFYREAKDGTFKETHLLFGEGHPDPSTSNLLSHLAPSDCCEAVVMKQPSWASSFSAVYDMKEVFGEGENIKFVLTIREITSAFNSKFDFICSHTTKSEKIRNKICVDGDTFVENIEQDSLQRHKCVERTKANSQLHGSELAGRLENCNRLLAVQAYDYEATFKTYADHFGDDKIICQFLTDLISAGGAATRRSIFDFAGLTNLDENNVASDTSGGHEHTYVLNDQQKQRILQLSAKYNTDTYDEDRLRTMCVQQTAQ